MVVSEQSTTLEWPHSSMRSCRRHRLVADTEEKCNNMEVGMGNLTYATGLTQWWVEVDASHKEEGSSDTDLASARYSRAVEPVGGTNQLLVFAGSVSVVAVSQDILEVPTVLPTKSCQCHVHFQRRLPHLRRLSHFQRHCNKQANWVACIPDRRQYLTGLLHLRCLLVDIVASR